MITFEEINVDEAMLQIFKTTNFPILKLHIEDEVNNINGNIVYEYLNGRDLSSNIYTNDDTSKYQWIAVINDNNIVALQLLHFIEDAIELVILEKVAKYNVHNIFKTVLEYVEERYTPFEIFTFPLHDKLKEEYKKYGFIEEDKELIKYYGNENNG